MENQVVAITKKVAGICCHLFPERKEKISHEKQLFRAFKNTGD